MGDGVCTSTINKRSQCPTMETQNQMQGRSGAEDDYTGPVKPF